jgi:hypothetical protein
MAILLQFDFKYPGPFGKEKAKNLKDHAQSITQEPGFMWKIWTESPGTEEGGGIYLFTDKPSALAYLSKHTARLKDFGVSEVRAKLFEINEELTAMTKGPVRL